MAKTYRIKPHIHSETMKECWIIEKHVDTFFFMKEYDKYPTNSHFFVWYDYDSVVRACDHLNSTKPTRKVLLKKFGFGVDTQ